LALDLHARLAVGEAKSLVPVEQTRTSLEDMLCACNDNFARPGGEDAYASNNAVRYSKKAASNREAPIWRSNPCN